MKLVRFPSVALAVAGTLAAVLSACGPSGDDSEDSLRLPPEDDVPSTKGQDTPPANTQAFAEARAGHSTDLSRKEREGEASMVPPPRMFELLQYDGPLGAMDAYIGIDPTPAADTRHPAIIWLVGGFSGSIGSTAWEAGPRENDQSAATFRKAGVVMMYPSQRGGNDSPGHHEGLFGEVDDVIAAARHLATLDYVDPDRIYLGGHSVGGTLALLAAAAAPELFRAVFSFGPIDDIRSYGQENVPIDISNRTEARLRSPVHWLSDIARPTFVFEGRDGNIESLLALRDANRNPLLHFFPVDDADHFSVIRPVSELVAHKILADTEADTAIELSAREVARHIETIHPSPRQPFPAGRPGSDRVFLEFGIYYPKKPEGLAPRKVLKHLITEEFPELNWSDEIREPGGDGWVSGIVVDDVAEDYAPPSVESLTQYFGKGISTEHALALQGSEQALIIMLEHPQEKALPLLRAANRLVDRIATESGGFPWDEETRQLYSPGAWRELIVSPWQEAIPDITTQITMHAYQDGEFLRAITLGMSKFGLPDVVAEQFTRSDSKSMGTLINLLCQALVEGAEIGADGLFELDLRKLMNASARESELETLVEDATGQARIAFKRGAWDFGDPENDLIEIGFDHYDGPDLFARQNLMLSSFLGSEDAVSKVDHNDELEAASAAAREQLPGLREDFQSGLQPGEVILVKSPFATPDDGREWMWVEVSKWDGDSITGTLKSEPHRIEDLQAGQQVEVSTSEVFDYIRRLPDGNSEGNTTGEVIRKMQESSER